MLWLPLAEDCPTCKQPKCEVTVNGEKKVACINPECPASIFEEKEEKSS